MVATFARGQQRRVKQCQIQLRRQADAQIIHEQLMPEPMREAALEGQVPVARNRRIGQREPQALHRAGAWPVVGNGSGGGGGGGTCDEVEAPLDAQWLHAMREGVSAKCDGPAVTSQCRRMAVTVPARLSSRRPSRRRRWRRPLKRVVRKRRGGRGAGALYGHAGSCECRQPCGALGLRAQLQHRLLRPRAAIAGTAHAH